MKNLLNSAFFGTHRLGLCLCLGLLVAAPQAVANDTSTSANQNKDTEVIDVKGRQSDLLGEAISASQGLVSQQEIQIRPILRTGEVLELVPGMVVTQHSGNGKANQYFLRGFNLDHGTDFATFVDNMPVNMPSHGHGQGYSDLNFVIAELIQSISYKKGPYYGQIGDFSGAGSAQLLNATSLDQSRFDITVGDDNYQRILLMDSVQYADGHWVYALEHNSADGPWSTINEDLNKYNGVLKHHRNLDDGELSVTLMAYDNRWNSADQIPQRAVNSGQIDDFGSIDPSVGGQSSRYSLSADWHNQDWQVSAYAINYDLNLWSNFTYYMDDADNGDQMEQVDQRWVYGGQISYTIDSRWFGFNVSNELGGQLRFDDIEEVGLYKTTKKRRSGAIRSDAVEQASLGVYWQSQWEISDDLRSTLSLRYDHYDFAVDGRINSNVHGVDLTANSGQTDDGLLSTKYSLAYSIDDHYEVYGSLGQGFHSNDARGTTIVRDPISGEGLTPVDPLVKSFGGEIGLRGFWTDKLNMSVALWYLGLDSELVFVGDAGNTQPSGQSERKGLELTAYYLLNRQWTLDLEFALADSHYTDEPTNANHIPGAIDKVVQMGLSGQFDNGAFVSARLRYFGDRPLDESAAVKSDASTMVNLRAGYKWLDWQLSVDWLNVLNSDDHDIDYYYASQLAGENEPVDDIHFHPFEPSSARVTLSYRW